MVGHVKWIDHELACEIFSKIKTNLYQETDKGMGDETRRTEWRQIRLQITDTQSTEKRENRFFKLYFFSRPQNINKRERRKRERKQTTKIKIKGREKERVKM